MNTHRRLSLTTLALALASALVAYLFFGLTAPAQAAAPRPTVTRLSAHQGSTAGSNRITVRGTRFTHVKRVLFGTTKATFRRVSAKRLSVKVPKHVAGRVYVVVVTNRGRSAKKTVARYTYVAPRKQPVAPLHTLSTWKPGTLALPAGAAPDAHAQLFGTSCASASLCAAYGSYQNEANEGREMLASYVGGHWVSVDPEPSTAGGISVRSVSCAGATCIAVGELNTGGHWDALIATLSGTTWTVTTAPHPAEEPNQPQQSTSLESVSCWAAGACKAVGEYLVDPNKSTEAAAIWTLKNGTWSAITAPLPSGADSTNGDQDVTLHGISCTSATFCSAVGQYVILTVKTGLVETFNGTTWKPDTAAAPTGNAAFLAAVSCVSAARCAAVGSYTAGSTGYASAYLSSWSGTAWTTIAAPLPADAADTTSQLDSVSCAAVTGCVAVGRYLPAGDPNSRALVERSLSTAWSGKVLAEPAAAIHDKPFSELEAVSCPSNGCAAGGDFESQAATGDLPQLSTLGAGGSSAVWTAGAAPLPVTGVRDGDLRAASCAPDGFCMEVGWYLLLADNTMHVLVEHN
ncbi:MAG TPA: IPT/TIG domain-containing protein [Marmoricola sp.]|nr:IPT/TIG domain-containing protein [Marmoricola sp.]